MGARACLVIAALAIAWTARDAHAQKHTVYVELLGRGGLYGVGYDVQLTPRLSVGATASAYPLHGQTIATLAPYVGWHVVRGRRHAWFAHAGPQLAVVSIRSPVATWDPEPRAGVAAQLTSGWEYRGRVVVRTFATVTAGKGGVAPWAGVSVGVAF